MARRRGPPSRGWKTFLRDHSDGIAVMDLFVVPTISFRLLYGLLILQHDRRHIYGWQLPRTRPLKGSPASWLRPVAGSRLHDTLSVIEIAFTAKYSSGVSARWASKIDRCRPGHRGKWIRGTSHRLDPKGMR